MARPMGARVTHLLREYRDHKVKLVRKAPKVSVAPKVKKAIPVPLVVMA